MKKCAWCGKEYPDNVQNCLVDGNELRLCRLEAEEDRPVLEKRVSVTGRVQLHDGNKNVLRTALGDELCISDGFAKLIVGKKRLTLRAMGGPYTIEYPTITALAKHWWWWCLSWESSISSGDVQLCSWNLRPVVAVIREHMRDEGTV